MEWRNFVQVSLYRISRKSKDTFHEEEQKGKIGPSEIQMQLLDALVEVLGSKEKMLDPRQLGSPQGAALKEQQ